MLVPVAAVPYESCDESSDWNPIRGNHGNEIVLVNSLVFGIHLASLQAEVVPKDGRIEDTARRACNRVAEKGKHHPLWTRL